MATKKKTEATEAKETKTATETKVKKPTKKVTTTKKKSKEVDVEKLIEEKGETAVVNGEEVLYIKGTTPEETEALLEATETVVGVDLGDGEDSASVHIIKSRTLEPQKLDPQKLEPQIISPEVIEEVVVNIATSTPTKDFALSLLRIFEERPNCVVTVKCIGAGATHQATKSIIELNKFLIAQGKIANRFDFWTNENEKSVSCIRLKIVEVLPFSLASALTGHRVEYVQVSTPAKKEGDK
jgi:stage V sporulation protein SpoVS